MTITRPTTLKAVAQFSNSLADFGRNLRDWLHEVRAISSRKQAVQMIASEPPLLKARFHDGHIADAWLAAYAEYLASRVHARPPEWAFSNERVSSAPVFADDSGSPLLRSLALARSPLAFKRRNIFTDAVELPLRLRAGRPITTHEEKRRVNAERQKRFRLQRAKELQYLRRQMVEGGKS